jgi:hypothetical protein
MAITSGGPCTVTQFVRTILSVDPGTAMGWAVFSPDLADCGLNDIPECYRPTHLVVEMPFYRPNTPDPQSIIKLAVKVGIILERYKKVPDILTPWPQTWGCASKQINEDKTWPVLTAAERAVLRAALAKVAPSARHNVIDAVALGLWRKGIP